MLTVPDFSTLESGLTWPGVQLLLESLDFSIQILIEPGVDVARSISGTVTIVRGKMRKPCYAPDGQ